MKKIFTILAALFIVATISAQSVNTVIIPRPMEAEAVKGAYTVTAKTAVCASEVSLVRPAELFVEYVEKDLGAKLNVKQAEKGGIILSLDKSLATEEYTLHVSSKGVKIVGGTPAAVFYGLQSLRQVVLNAKHKGVKVAIDCMTVKDKPHFGYRGGMLDVCRHFFNVEEVKKFIDILAMHKLNRFHWHLTEDQGWRIEIKSHPELTKIGSVRKETAVYNTNPKSGRTQVVGYDGKPYGGFFTQDEVRDIVRYAAERYIEVIPEIDMPGHMVAALATYPELGCTKGPYEVRKTWGIAKDVLCAGRETTYAFIEDVLDEVVALFPSKYIHIGGDECPKHRWKECPDCQKRIKEEGLKDEHELQSYFMKRIEKYLNTKHGRNIIGWDEILEGGVSKTATVMAWRGAKRGVVAAKLGNKVIMTPTHFCYLDYHQDSTQYRPVGRHVPLEKVYSFDPMVEGIAEADAHHVLGVQGNLWTEWVMEPWHAEMMLYPRVFAIAETGWTPAEKKNWPDFERRSSAFSTVARNWGYNVFVKPMTNVGE